MTTTSHIGRRIWVRARSFVARPTATGRRRPLLRRLEATTAVLLCVSALLATVAATTSALAVPGAVATTPKLSWVQFAPATSPPARVAASLAFDAGTGQTVLFGGDGATNGHLNDTWTWNGTTWKQLNPPTSPPARVEASMAYDSRTGQLVLFGGFGGLGDDPPLDDTWTWNGTTWTQLNPPTSPPARERASMAYDPSTGQLVLFGGYGPGYLHDTWTWDGTTWTQQSPKASPSDRIGASLADDPGTGQLVLFGGDGGNVGYLNDTWTWDGTNWTQLSPATRPSARWDAPMAYDPGRGEVVLFGGRGTGGGLGDTWAWKGTTWTQLNPATSPPARTEASMAYDPSTGQLVLFSGLDENFVHLDDTWTYQPVLAPKITSSHSDAFTQGVPDKFTVTATGTPSSLVAETGTLPAGITFIDNGNGTASLSGDATQSGTFPLTVTAANGVSPNATQLFDLTVNPPVTTWSQLSPGTDPGDLDAASVAYDPATSQLVLFGGSTGTNAYVDGTWTWNGTTWAQLSPAGSPPARARASMSYDAATGQLLLFGGIGAGATFLNDTWSWNGTTWTQLAPATSPPVRYNASMAYDPITSQLLLFGGTGSSTATGADTWTWNGTTWTQLSPATSPSARARSMIAYDPATSQLVLFGGSTPSGSPSLNDTWTWNGTTWTQLAPATSPGARAYGVLGFDAATEQLVLFGGVAPGSTLLADTWTWTGTTWSQLSPVTCPSARDRSAAAYDPATSQLLLYGGGSSTLYQSDTWSYGPVPASAPTAPSIGTATAGNVSATVTFNPPANNNGSAVTSYMVTATDLTTPANGRQTASGVGSPIRLSGLTNGDRYTFRVRATNGVGTGASSAASNAVTPATVPGAPIIGAANAGNHSASVAFTAPANDGDATITGYTVTARDLSSEVNGGQTASGLASPITVSGLTNGDSYTFAVTATNRAGTGPPSAASNEVVPFASITISSLEPGQLAQRVAANVVIDGSGFVSSLNVTVSGGGITLTLVSVAPTSVTIRAKVGASASLGARNVTVSDVNGSATCTGCLNVIATPTLTSISPASASQGSTTNATLTGTGFAAGAKVTGPKGVTFSNVIVVNSTTLAATMKVSATATTGTNLSVTVTNDAVGGYGKVTAGVLTIT
jgi:hypothetical protein